jgi:hypothetical protein
MAASPRDGNQLTEHAIRMTTHPSNVPDAGLKALVDPCGQVSA